MPRLAAVESAWKRARAASRFYRNLETEGQEAEERLNLQLETGRQQKKRDSQEASNGQELAWMMGLPPVKLLDVLRHPERFQTGDDQDYPIWEWRYPLPGTPRVAVIGETVRTSPSWRISRVRNFRHFTDLRLKDFAPQVVAAPIDTLRAMAQEALEGGLELPSVNRCIVAFTGIVQGSLRAQDRDLLWRAFQVPVFEQFRGFAGEVLAEECEAHAGLHILEERLLPEISATGELLVSFLANPRMPLFRLATGMAARMEKAPCACGRPGARLVGVNRIFVEIGNSGRAVRRAAAS